MSGECHRADKLLEDFIDKYLEQNPTFTREEQETHRRIQRQADAFTPEELHDLFQVCVVCVCVNSYLLCCFALAMTSLFFYHKNTKHLTLTE